MNSSLSVDNVGLQQHFFYLIFITIFFFFAFLTFLLLFPFSHVRKIKKYQKEKVNVDLNNNQIICNNCVKMVNGYDSNTTVEEVSFLTYTSTQFVAIKVIIKRYGLKNKIHSSTLFLGFFYCCVRFECKNFYVIIGIILMIEKTRQLVLEKDI